MSQIDKPQSFGWWMDYCIRLHKEYSYSIDYIMNDLDMLTGWTLYSWSIYNDPVNRFNGLRMVNSPASREADRLLMEIKEFNNIK